MILYEAGETLRFNDEFIEIGVNGILNFMREIDMIDTKFCRFPNRKIFLARSDFWVRAPRSGIHLPYKKLGQLVRENEVIGEISNPFGDHKTPVLSNVEGIIVGMSMLPLANKGDALFHIACEKESDRTQSQLPENALHNLDVVNS
jgi:predicted deacylase